MDVSNLNAAAKARPAGSRNKPQNVAEAAAQVVRKDEKRIQQQRGAVSVELSSVGKLKAAFSEVQKTSRALTDSQQPLADASVRKAAEGFIKAFNTATQAARSTTARQSQLADNDRARAAEADLRRSLSADTEISVDLKKIGITQQTDGTLAIDAKKLDDALKAEPAAVRNALSRAGEQADRIATRELSNNGNTGGGSVNSSDSRARNIEARQAEQQTQATAAPQTVSAKSSTLDNDPNTGVAAYQRIFSL